MPSRFDSAMASSEFASPIPRRARRPRRRSAVSPRLPEPASSFLAASRLRHNGRSVRRRRHVRRSRSRRSARGQLGSLVTLCDHVLYARNGTSATPPATAGRALWGACSGTASPPWVRTRAVVLVGSGARLPRSMLAGASAGYRHVSDVLRRRLGLISGVRWRAGGCAQVEPSGKSCRTMAAAPSRSD